MKEFSFRCFILLVMLSLVFVAYDMSKPVILMNREILAQSEMPIQDYDFMLNILLPIFVYLVSIGGFLYLLIEDFKLLKKFTHQNRLAKFVWSLWIIILIGLILIPIFLGFQLLSKSFVLAVIATALFLILIGFLYWLSCRSSYTKRL
ncbi:MAG: hypothetical protein K0R80_1726 [Clostridia bacterium]|nr:hypothetical protein [Clostridia bacterium]